MPLPMLLPGDLGLDEVPDWPPVDSRPTFLTITAVKRTMSVGSRNRLVIFTKRVKTESLK